MTESVIMPSERLLQKGVRIYALFITGNLTQKQVYT